MIRNSSRPYWMPTRHELRADRWYAAQAQRKWWKAERRLAEAMPNMRKLQAENRRLRMVIAFAYQDLEDCDETSALQILKQAMETKTK